MKTQIQLWVYAMHCKIINVDKVLKNLCTSHSQW